MAYVNLAHVYDHVTVLRVKMDVDVKYAQSDGTYKGSTIMYETKDGEAKTASITSFWLNKPKQAALKASWEGLKMDDEVTLYKTKEVDEIEVAGMTAKEIRDKKIGYFGVKKIIPGHVVPEEMSTPCHGYAQAAPAGGNAGGYSGGKRDLTGMKVGGATNAAYDLLPADKASNPKTVIAASKKLFDLIQKLIPIHKESSGVNEYEAGQAAGAAVGNACKIVSSFAEVEAAALVQLNEINGEVAAYIKAAEPKKEEPKAEAKPEPKAEPKAEEPVKEAAKEEEVPAEAAAEEPGEFDDDIPF